MRGARDVVMIVCTVLAVAGAVAAWTVLVGGFDTSTIASLKGVGGPVKMRFPLGTELVQARLMKGMDWTIYAKLRMPRSEVQGFLAAAPFKGAMLSVQGAAESGFLDDVEATVWAGMTDWHPLRAKHAVVTQGETGPSDHGPEIMLLVDLDDPTVAVVYLHAWTM